MKKIPGYEEMLIELGFGESLTDEEIERYKQSDDPEKEFPDVVYNEYSFKRIKEDLSPEDFIKAMLIKQYKTTASIKKYALFFVVLAVIGIAASLLVALSSLGS